MRPESAQEQHDLMMEEKPFNVPSRKVIEAVMAENGSSLARNIIATARLNRGGNAKIWIYKKPSRGNSGKIWSIV